MRIPVLALSLVLLASVDAAAAGLEAVPLLCTGTAGHRTGSILLVDGELAGIRLDRDRATTFVVYGENEQGMALVDPLEHGLDRKVDLGFYSAVLQISAGNAVKVRARQDFVAALLSGAPVGAIVEAMRCVVARSGTN